MADMGAYQMSGAGSMPGHADASLPRLRVALVLAMSISLLTGCRNVEYQLIVDNQSEQAILVRVPLGEGYSGKYDVRPIGARERALANAWSGDAAPRIELLDQDCRVLGIFAPSPEGVLRVDAFAGVSAQVQPYRMRRQGETEAPPVDSCHGTVLR